MNSYLNVFYMLHTGKINSSRSHIGHDFIMVIE